MRNDPNYRHMAFTGRCTVHDRGSGLSLHSLNRLSSLHIGLLKLVIRSVEFEEVGELLPQPMRREGENS